jgi:predicted Fe-S protein YdhL (DUF1289 family)
MTDDSDTPVPSPCRRRCELHPIERRCLGCLRTIDEIAGWARFGEAERRAIVAAVAARRAALGDAEPSPPPRSR